MMNFVRGGFCGKKMTAKRSLPESSPGDNFTIISGTLPLSYILMSKGGDELYGSLWKMTAKRTRVLGVFTHPVWISISFLRLCNWNKQYPSRFFWVFMSGDPSVSKSTQFLFLASFGSCLIIWGTLYCLHSSKLMGNVILLQVFELQPGHLSSGRFSPAVIRENFGHNHRWRS